MSWYSWKFFQFLIWYLNFLTGTVSSHISHFIRPSLIKSLVISLLVAYSSESLHLRGHLSIALFSSLSKHIFSSIGNVRFSWYFKADYALCISYILLTIYVSLMMLPSLISIYFISESDALDWLLFSFSGVFLSQKCICYTLFIKSYCPL